MNCYTTYRGHIPTHDTIYTLDIETSSFFFDTEGEIHSPSDYRSYDTEDIDLHTCMYIWMVGIDSDVYYGRTPEELISFLTTLCRFDDSEKIFWIHNFQFEFEFLKSFIKLTDVFARNSHRPITARADEYNIVFRCSYQLSHVRLELLPEIYGLDTVKQTGKLDYDLIRTPETPLTDDELLYCESDCLVVYEYIKAEMLIYGKQQNIPLTATGKVRQRLHDIVDGDTEYKLDISARCDTDPLVYNALLRAFAGGCVMSNYLYEGEHLTDVTSYDICSDYPSILVTEKFPAGQFKPVKGNIDPYMLMDDYAYLLHIKISDMHSRYDNAALSYNKTLRTRGVILDNGKVRRCNELEIFVTELDMEVILMMYGSGKGGKDPLKVEVMEAWCTPKKRLPKKLVKFILDMYVQKTSYKDLPEKHKEYQLIKSQFNSIFGMCITNDIRANVNFTGKDWQTEDISDDDIIRKLKSKKRQGFLPFSAGVWCSSYARYNLLMNTMQNDEYVVYCDTDSIKMLEGYQKTVILNYNEMMKQKLISSSRYYGLPISMYMPKDRHGVEHPMGLFEVDAVYSDFITLGPKQYAAIKDGELEITLSGVPKEGVSCLNGEIENFREGLVFDSDSTGKLIHFYVDDLNPCIVTDYMGKTYTVTDKSGVVLMPADYVLGQVEEEEDFASSERAMYGKNKY